MRRAIFCVFLLSFLFLVSCNTNSQPVSSTPIPSSPTSPYDGKWEGTGQTNEGKTFVLSFLVEGGTLTRIEYKYDGPKGVPCFNSHYFRIPTEQRPHIEGGSLSAPLGPDMDVTATFDSESTASGHVNADVFYRYETCNGQFEFDWTATKQSEIAQPVPISPPKTRSNPLETLVQILIFGLSNGAVLALNAIGVTLIYSTVRTLNLAHGDVFALTTVVVTTLVKVIGIQQNWAPLPLMGALLVTFFGAMGAGALLSVGVERLAFRPFRGHSRLAPLIATLSLSFILFQAALVWRTFQASWIPGEHRSVPGLPEVPTDGIPSLLPELNLTNVLGLSSNVIVRFSDVFVIVIALLLVAITTRFIQRTSTGRAIRALSQNSDLAQMVGVDMNRTIRNAFMVGGLLAGAAGFIFTLYYARPFGFHGAQSGLFAFMAALLGGIGNPVGALLASLLVGVASSLSDYYLSAQWTPAILLVLLILLLTWRPTGLASSDSEGTESTLTRDTVIVTAPGQTYRVRQWLVILLITLAVLPIFLQVFHLGGQIILRSAIIFALLALGLNLVLGISGLLDFGFAASYGLGAYTAALILNRLPMDFTVVLLFSAIVGGAFGWIKGMLAKRLRSDYLAVATLALGLLARQLIINLDFTGGVGGVSGLSALRFLNFKLISPTHQFYLVFGLVVLASWLSFRLIASRTGRAWIASSEDELAAASVGVNIGRSRVQSMMLGSALAGIAGALFASTFTFVDPDLFAFHISSMVLTMVILGGAGSVPGAILGAILIVSYDKMIVPQIADFISLIWPKNFYIGSAPDIRGASFFNFGIALYLTVLFRARKKS